MTESQFIQTNQSDWEQLEASLDQSRLNAAELSRLFVKVSSDLSYARTYYPNRMVRVYLNDLVQKTLDRVRRREESKETNVFTNFYFNTLPLEIIRHKWSLLLSLIIFAIAIGIGIVSSAADPDFLEVVVGRDYVDMTKANIEKGDPMSVYKAGDETSSFFMIAYNNVRVAFISFVAGILGAVGTVFVLFYNGVMVGSFQYFFVSKDLFLTSFLTIWIHGTLEIISIVIAGGAGLILGGGLLFPRTYHRSTSLKSSARSSIRILLSVLPIIVAAAILESYVTQYTGMPTLFKWLIILSSLAFMVYVYIIYPFYFFDLKEVELDLVPFVSHDVELTRLRSKTFSQIVIDSINQLKSYMITTGTKVWLPILLVGVVWIYICYHFMDPVRQAVAPDLNFPELTLLALMTFPWIYASLQAFYSGENHISLKRCLKPIIDHPFVILICVVSMTPIFFMDRYFYVYLMIMPIAFSVISLERTLDNKEGDGRTIGDHIIHSFGNYLLCNIMIIAFIEIVSIGLNSGPMRFVIDFINLHHIFSYEEVTLNFLLAVFSLIIALFVIAFGYILCSNVYYSGLCNTMGMDIKQRFEYITGKK